MNDISPNQSLTPVSFLNCFPTPTVVSQVGDQATRRFIEFFTARIRNPGTRQVYAHAV